MNQDDIIYGLNDRPPFGASLLAAFQHLMAIFLGIITPTLVLGRALNLGEEVAYLVSMSLMVSGVATFVQCRRIGPFGSGLLSIQGTSFSFLGSLIAAGLAARSQGFDTRHVLGLLFGICFIGSFIEMILSRFLHLLRRVITPIVTGSVVLLIGLSLIKISITDIGGGMPLLLAQPDQFASLANVGIGLAVLLLVVAINRSRHPLLRMGSIMIALLAGYLFCIAIGWVSLPDAREMAWISVPVPFKYGFHFDWTLFIPVAFIYLITTIESVGDLTATSMISREPIEGEIYMKRIRNGILGDGFNSLLAAVFNTFPNTTFSQNNGVIQITGVASRHVGYYIAGLLILLGLFPVIGGFFERMPPPVLGGATLIMFGSVAAAGIKIIASQELDRRAMLILALSLSLGIGVQVVPQLLQHLPDTARRVFESPITTGGLTALLANLFIPQEKQKT